MLYLVENMVLLLSGVHRLIIQKHFMIILVKELFYMSINRDTNEKTGVYYELKTNELSWWIVKMIE